MLQTRFNHGFHGLRGFIATKAQKARREIRRRFRRLTQIGRILFLPAGADLAAAFSIPVSVKPAAGVRWAIEDGPHKNMQTGKKGFFVVH